MCFGGMENNFDCNKTINAPLDAPQLLTRFHLSLGLQMTD